MWLIIIILILCVIIESVSSAYQRQVDRVWWIRYFLWLGIFTHETAHYIMCKVTGAPVEQFQIGLRTGHVIHGKSKLPILGELLIATAPFVVGNILLVLSFGWLTDWHWGGLTFETISTLDISKSFSIILEVLKQIPISSWKFVVYILINIQLLATFIPSGRDIRNVGWLLVVYSIVSVFVPTLQKLNILLALILSFSLCLLIVGWLVFWLYNLIFSRSR